MVCQHQGRDLEMVVEVGGGEKEGDERLIGAWEELALVTNNVCLKWFFRVPRAEIGASLEPVGVVVRTGGQRCPNRQHLRLSSQDSITPQVGCRC